MLKAVGSRGVMKVHDEVPQGLKAMVPARWSPVQGNSYKGAQRRMICVVGVDGAASDREGLDASGGILRFLVGDVIVAARVDVETLASHPWHVELE